MNLDALNLDALRPILPVPMWQKLLGLLASFVLILVAYVYLGWIPIQEKIETQKAQVEREQILLKRNQAIAKDLPRKKKEFAKLEKQLKLALNMLPKKSQIPDLLESVSWAGKDSGLEFSDFTPKAEATKQIYAEVPVSVIVSGSYKQLLTFLKRVGEMSRIVAVKNLSLSKGKANSLSIKGSILTYRFVDEKPKRKVRRKRR